MRCGVLRESIIKYVFAAELIQNIAQSIRNVHEMQE